MNFLQPWQPSVLAPPRSMQGVNRIAHFGTTGLGAFVDVDRGPVGDARGSSANALTDEFLGDYDYAAATNTYVATVWNDVRLASDCPAVDAFRETASTTQENPRPNPDVSCAPTFGNSDIWSWTSFPGP
jgi:hypothetical protein